GGDENKGTTKMIICSKHEGNGTYREFMLDDTDLAGEIQVKTHLRHRADGDQRGDDWIEAGFIKRDPSGVIAAIFKPTRNGKAAKIKLESTFTNEIAALQAIAVNYQAPTLKN